MTANEKRLIDANALLKNLDKFINPMPDANGLNFLNGLCTAITEIEDAPTVDAVEVAEYIELREQYDKIFTEFHELRDAFVDYVYGGVPNPSPFCKNKCHGCCDSYGWCKHDDKCTGFNPSEGFSDGERKDNGTEED